jgi:iron transport multicopper oxidase
MVRLYPPPSTHHLTTNINLPLRLFHCHIDWHMSSGLAVTIVEDPLTLQSTLQIPKDHYDTCTAAKVPTVGNAAGNTKDYLDLTGANVSPKPLPAGFTARGIVALVFSVVAAFVGCAVISWYGAAPLGETTQRAAEHQIAETEVAEVGSPSGGVGEEVAEDIVSHAPKSG